MLVPRVSVVIPAYNREDVLKRCLDSVFEQTFEDFEVIVVDDHSDDCPRKVAESYPDTRVIRHPENLGANAARNTGIRESRGDLVAFLDTDDEWHPTKLEKQVATFDNSSSNLGAVYAGYFISDEEGERLGALPKVRGDVHEQELHRDHICPTSTVTVSREAVVSVGGFDPSLPARQDYDLWLRLSEKYRFDYVDEPLATLHTGRNDRISQSYEDRLGAEKMILNQIKKEIKDFSWHKKRQIMASQHAQTAEYLYTIKEFQLANRYLVKAISYYPISFRQWVFFLLTLFSIPPRHPIVVRIKELSETLTK